MNRRKIVGLIAVYIMFASIAFGSTIYFEPGKSSTNMGAYFQLNKTEYPILSNQPQLASPGNLGYIGIKDISSTTKRIKFQVYTDQYGMNFVHDDDPSIQYPYKLRIPYFNTGYNVGSTYSGKYNEIATFTTANSAYFIGLLLGIDANKSSTMKTGTYTARFFVDIYESSSADGTNYQLSRTFSIVLHGVYQSAGEERTSYYFEVFPAAEANRLTLRTSGNIAGEVATNYLSVARVSFMSEVGINSSNNKYSMYISPTNNYADTTTKFEFKKTGTENSLSTNQNSVTYALQATCVYDNTSLTGKTNSFQLEKTSSHNFFHTETISSANPWRYLDITLKLKLSGSVADLLPGEYKTNIYVILVSNS